MYTILGWREYVEGRTAYKQLFSFVTGLCPFFAYRQLLCTLAAMAPL